MLFYQYQGKRYTITIQAFYIELTTSCNLKCPYCYNLNDKKINIDCQEVIAFLEREASKERVPEVQLSGGEPFLYPQLKEMINIANANKLRVLVVSNGELIEKEFLSDYLQTNYLQLTLDSIYEEEHNISRGSGNYQKILRILEYCKEYGLSKHINLRLNVVKGNQTNMEDFVKFALGYGIEKVGISVLRGMGRAKENRQLLFQHNTDVGQLLAINAEMARLKLLYKDKIDIISNTFENQSGCPFNEPQNFYLVPRIDSCGNMYLCQSFNGIENIIGNIFECSLQEMFLSKKFENYISMLFERQTGNESCQQCLFEGNCTGGCPAEQYSETGNYLKCSSQCGIIREIFKNRILNTIAVKDVKDEAVYF